MILATENGPIHYEVSGAGSPLVFISGWAMSSACWQPVVERLDGSYRCLTYDARGIGRSQPAAPSATFDLREHAEDLHRLLEVEGIYDATFVAHEMGCLLAALCVKRHPQSARALVLVSPRASFSQDEIKSLSVFTPASLALREIATFPVIRNLVAFRFRHAPQPARDRLFDDFAALSPRAAYETALSAADYYADSPVETLLAETRLPALLICGDEDKKAVAEARRLFGVAREGKLATLTDCHFLPMLEYPQQIARLLDGFAQQAGIGSRKLARRD